MKEKANIFLVTGIMLFLVSCSSEEKKPNVTVIEPKNSLLVVPVANPYQSVDKSPMDMSYFPDNYPALKMTHPEMPPPVMRIIYSRPQKSGRKLFGGLLKYNQPWRLGANEASEIEFFKDVTIQSKKIKAGRYILYCIPEESQWILVLNTNLYSWGLQLDPKEDIAKFPVPVEQTPSSVEYFTMVFQKTDTGAELLMTWDNVITRLAISF